MNFATLMQGKLTPLVFFHLDNLLEFGALKICVMTSAKNCEILRNDYNKYLCFHYSDKYLEKFLGQREYKDNIEIRYFDHDFAFINVLKWYLIAEVLLEEGCSNFIFSDMDIFWNVSLSHEMKKYLREKTSKSIYVQQDGDQFCTGIMIWENCQAHRDYVAELIDYHEGSFSTKPLMDQEVFNLVSSQSESKTTVKFLPHDTFLIGRKISSRLLRGNSILKSIAIHANYIVGQPAKYRVLRNISKFIQEPTRRNRFISLVSLFWYQKLLLPYEIWRSM